MFCFNAATTKYLPFHEIVFNGFALLMATLIVKDLKIYNCFLFKVFLKLFNFLSKWFEKCYALKEKIENQQVIKNKTIYNF